MPTIQITMDASPTGWGAHVHDPTANGHWTLREDILHINLMELFAIFKAFSGVPASPFGTCSTSCISMELEHNFVQYIQSVSALRMEGIQVAGTITLCLSEKWLTDQTRSQLLGFFLASCHLENGSQHKMVFCRTS